MERVSFYPECPLGLVTPPPPPISSGFFCSVLPVVFFNQVCNFAFSLPLLKYVLVVSACSLKRH